MNNQQKIKVIITGVTGMVGEGVLHECLKNELVEKVLVIARKTCDIKHEKLLEIIHPDFNDLSAIERSLMHFDACFFCSGVSSIGLSEMEYKPLTYDITLHVGSTLAKLNKQLTFCYVSGAGTDSTEKGRSMWARIKGKTENDLSRLPFKAAYHFRPAVLKPTRGLKRTLKPYKYFNWLIPIMQWMLPNYICSLEQLGKAMIAVSILGYDSTILEVKDIVIASQKV